MTVIVIKVIYTTLVDIKQKYIQANSLSNSFVSNGKKALPIGLTVLLRGGASHFIKFCGKILSANVYKCIFNSFQNLNFEGCNKEKPESECSRRHCLKFVKQRSRYIGYLCL